jgi:GT2 family glycosyltransferase
MVGAIGVPCAEQARWSSFWGCLEELVRPPGWAVVPVRGSSVAANRNLIAKIALERGAEWVFWLDDDLVFKPDVLMKLLARHCEAVVGLSLRRVPPFEPLWFTENVPEQAYMLKTLPADDALVPIAAGTSGGLLTSRRVLEAVGHPWWTLGQFAGREDEWCDDMDFCRRLTRAGVQLYGDPSTHFGHIMNCDVWPYKNGTWNRALARNGQAFAVIPWET